MQMQTTGWEEAGLAVTDTQGIMQYLVASLMTCATCLQEFSRPALLSHALLLYRVVSWRPNFLLRQWSLAVGPKPPRRSTAHALCLTTAIYRCRALCSAACLCSWHVFCFSSFSLPPGPLGVFDLRIGVSPRLQSLLSSPGAYATSEPSARLRCLPGHRHRHPEIRITESQSIRTERKKTKKKKLALP
jgi:hypothetical protein